MIGIFAERRFTRAPIGLRRDCSERSGRSRPHSSAHVVQAPCFSHVIGDKLEAAYLRSDFFEKRARLMQAWPQFVTGKEASGNVALHAAQSGPAGGEQGPPHAQS